jgi:hypothetical protein
MRGKKRHRKKAAKKAAERRRSRIRAMTVGFTFNTETGRQRARELGLAMIGAARAFRAQFEDLVRIANAGREGLEALNRKIKREQIVRDLASRTTWSAANVRWLLDGIEAEGLPACSHLAERIIQAWAAGAPITPGMLSDMIRALDRQNPALPRTAGGQLTAPMRDQHGRQVGTIHSRSAGTWGRATLHIPLRSADSKRD